MASPLQVHYDTLSDYLQWMLENQSDEDEFEVPVFTWQNTEYSCNYSWTQQRDLGAGGFIPTDGLVIEPLEPLDGTPESEQKITFLNREFRIRTVKMAAGKNPTLTCYDPAKGS